MPDATTGQDKPEARPPFVGPSERRAAPEKPPLPPGERVGFAVVGLGRLSLEAILPALAMSKLCRLAAVMTGDKDKGRRVALQYGAPAEAVYGYDEWDALGRNAAVRVVYIVTPNGLHLEQVTTGGGHRPPCALREAHGQHVCRSRGDDPRLCRGRGHPDDRLPLAI